MEKLWTIDLRKEDFGLTNEVLGRITSCLLCLHTCYKICDRDGTDYQCTVRSLLKIAHLNKCNDLWIRIGVGEATVKSRNLNSRSEKLSSMFCRSFC